MAKYIGVMSGTSMDSVDVALCEITSNHCTLLAYDEYPFDQALKEECFELINATTTLAKVSEIDTRLALLFSTAINIFIQKHDIQDVEAIGLHGQTLWHAPNGLYPNSLQLGNPSVVAAQTDRKVVADFRRKDVALGGQGAPFAPAFHRFLFGGDQSVGVVNIGGMANITILGEQTIGYDTGVGNALLDLWAKRAFDLAYDEDGIRAQAGMVDYALLVQMLADPYFRMHPPKSTGREYFNEAWLDQQLIGFEEVSAKDIQATLTALTVQTIGNEAKRFRLKKLYVCGGGVKNSFLMQSLQDYLAPVDVIPTDEMGVSSQALEAMAFAWLAYKRVQGERVELSSVTGATHDTILGGIYE